MDFTPFFMVHSSKVVLPKDIDYSSSRVRAYIEEGNQATLEDSIDQLDEARAWHYCCAAPSASKTCDATTRETSVLASSTSGTWSSDEFKAARTDTSYLHLGRGRSSSTKCSDPELTRYSMRTGGSSPTHGTSNICARFILE
jgi:hypothetical protein